MDDAEPQPVLAPLSAAAIFLVATVRPGAEGDVRDVLGDVSGLTRSVGFRYPDSHLRAVVGIGSDLWDRLVPGRRPAKLHPFEAIHGTPHTAVATSGDLLFHLRASRIDVCFELAAQLMRRLDGFADVVDEVHGFKYHDQRDLLGFVDGTENPTGRTAQRSVLIGDEDAAFAGGSYVIVQRYQHDMTAWNALPVSAQEAVIGRTKVDNIELPDEQKAPSAHTVLTVIEDEQGNERKILRDNMPFGRIGTGEFGTYFIGYAADPGVIELMLRRMFLGDPPGTYDRILDFSTAVTGSLYFVPPVGLLDDLPR